jgi:type IV pilus assembly protein PilC
MAEFVVKLADERGRILKQTVEQASSAAEIRERYAAQDLIVYDIKPAGLFGQAGGARRKKVPLEKFVIFNSQFVTLIKAGLPILTALDLLGKQQRDPFFKSVLADVRNRVKGGEYLSTAFEVQNITGKIYSTTLLAGEKSGNLEEVLNRYISFQRISIAFRKKLIASLIYPALLVVMMIALFTVLIVFVVPRFGALYKELNAELPPVTQLLIAIGNNAQQYATISAIVIIAVGLLFWQWKNSKAGSETLDRMFYRAPLIGEVILKYHVAMFARMMSTLLGGGLPLVQALETAGS